MKLLLLPVMVMLWERGQGCGISTHTEIGHRALHHFSHTTDSQIRQISELLARHQDAFQAGHPYPDSFYNSLCFEGRYHSESEDTHWGRFVQVGLDYIARRYPVPWDQNTEKLVAFLFGIISHQVADITWHSLVGLSDGFISALSQLNFGGNFGLAHDHADVGGDMIGVFHWNVTEYATEWYVPVNDLVEIYKDYYGEEESVLTEDIIDVCSGMLLVGRVGEQVIGQVLYPDFAKTGPAMIDMYRDYYLGGLDDMAFWTAMIWTQATVGLLNGTESCSIPDNTLQLQCGGESGGDSQWYSGLSVNLPHLPPDLAAFPFLPTIQDLEIVKSERGSRMRIPEGKITAAHKLVQESLPVSYTSPEYSEERAGKTREPVVHISGTADYAQLGKSLKLAMLDDDDIPDLVVGEPGANHSGCVHIYLGKDGYWDELTPTTSLCGEQEWGRFGSAVAVLDYNLDTVMDIVVSDPYWGAEQLTYNGSLHFYMGRMEEGEYSLQLEEVIVSPDYRANYGTVLGVGDADGDGAEDLLVGSPLGEPHQTGHLDIYHSREGSVRGRRGADIRLRGSQEYERFGSSVAVEAGILAVGSHTYRVCEVLDCSHGAGDLQAAGRVSLYSAAGQSYEEVGRIDGTRDKAGLGSSLAFINVTIHGGQQTVLAVGESSGDSESGGLEQAGRVNLYSIENTGSDVTLEELAVLSGESELGRFGLVVTALPPGLGWTVSAPLHGTALAARGQVYVYNVDKEIPGGDVTSHCPGLQQPPCPASWAEFVLDPEDESGLFGSSVSSAVDGEGVLWLAVGADSSSMGARMGGAVTIYTIHLHR